MIQEKGYIVTEFLKETDFNHLVLKLEKYVKKQLESLNIKVGDLRQYHESVNNDDLHFEVYQKLYKNGSLFEEIDFLAKSIVLESRAFELNDFSLIEETVIAAPPIGGSCITFSGPSNDSVVVRGITFSGGSNHYGGGIVIESCSPTLIDVLVMDNSAEIGGGIYLSESNSKLIRVTVRNNGANLGGGVYSTSGNPIFDQVRFEQNFAYWGGGVYLDDSKSQINGSRFIDNQAFIEGGGLFQTGGSSTLAWTGFENNDGTDFAGAIKAHQTSMQINQATFSGIIAGIGSFMSLENS